MADDGSRGGDRYATTPILEYVDGLHAVHDGALEAAFGAPAKNGMPAIQVARAEGKLLGMLLRLHGARRVVEVGTLAGYSAIHMARALPEGGRLWTIEYDAHHANVAQLGLEAAGVADRVSLLRGDAAQVLAELAAQGPFDAVFLDADKGRYDVYGRWARDNLRRGGLLLADNVYFFGRLLEDSEEARAVRRFHEEAAAHFDTACIPSPDGLLLGIRR